MCTETRKGSKTNNKQNAINLSAMQPHQFGTQVKILKTLTDGWAPEALCTVALSLQIGVAADTEPLVTTVAWLITLGFIYRTSSFEMKQVKLFTYLQSIQNLKTMHTKWK